MKRTTFVSVFIILFGATVASISQLRADPRLPPVGAAWNSYCHSKGAEGVSLETCCNETNQQCSGNCAANDSDCQMTCIKARDDCIAAGIVKKGGGVPAKPVTSGKPTEQKQR